jgi:hypothetical protein
VDGEGPTGGPLKGAHLAGARGSHGQGSGYIANIANIAKIANIEIHRGGLTAPHPGFNLGNVGNIGNVKSVPQPPNL